jgi:2-oxoisovalerate dehydrogenase E2 component (dihydrolipoyl transacylase)
MIKEFRLPDVGEGLTEADIVNWHVKPGDSVEVNQVIVEIETAKALVELPCPFDGTVSRLLADEGQTVTVGTPIIAVETAHAEPSGTAPAAQPAAEPDESHSVLVGYGVRPSTTARRRRIQPSPANGGTAATRALAKPPVRKLARDLGVDLNALAGTGPAGSVTREDVQRAAAGSAPGRSEAPVKAGQRIPVRGVRKHTAAAMVASAFTAPHVTEFLDVDATATMDAVRRVRDLPEFAGVRVSPLLFVARALLVAITRNPVINSSWDEPAQEIAVHGQVNLGVAVATDRGLLVPNVKDAGALPLEGLARALDSLAATAREGKSTPTDLTGGTITITNVGVFGIDAGTPILTPGEAAILAFGRVREAPWVHDHQLAVRQVTTLSLSFDHRIVDGELGSAVLRDVGSMLEDPVRLLAWS